MMDSEPDNAKEFEEEGCSRHERDGIPESCHHHQSPLGYKDL